MTTIRIHRVHQLGPENARAQVETFARTLKEELQIDYEWNGNRLRFRHPGASGTLDVGADAIDLDLKLGMLLWLQASAIEKAINERLDAALE